MNRQDILTLFDYNAWGNERILGAVESLTAEQFLPLIHSLQHLVNHGTYHRGQVTTLLRQLGATPVSTDMSRFFLDRAARKGTRA